MKALAVGDLHLDGLARLFPANHLELQQAEIEKVYSYGYRKGINNVFYLGDIGDTHVLSAEATCVLISILKKYDKDFHQYLILGNHDFRENGVHSMKVIETLIELRILKNVKLFVRQTVCEVDGIPVNFCPFPNKEGKAHHLNVGHFETPGAKNDNGYPVKEGQPVDEKHLWVLGHLHTPHGNFTGTLYQLSFVESEKKGFEVIEVTSKKGRLKMKREHVRTSPDFRLKTLEVETKHDLKKIKDNPNWKYRLIVKSDYELPDDIMGMYPNVVTMVGYKTKKQKEAAKSIDTLASSSKVRLPSEKKLLKKIFKEEGRTKEQLRRALELVESTRG